MLRDLRFAFLLMAKERWYSAVAIVALALGIGVNATVFTLVNAILIRGLPYKDSAQLYMLGTQNKSGDRWGVSAADFQDWRTDAKSFSAFAAFSNNGVNVSDDRSAPQNVRSASLTAQVFPLLSIQPLIGRNFSADDERTGAESVVIIGHALWKSRYAEEPGILGKTLRLDGKPATIVGVMPDGMQFPNNTELWTPVVVTAEQQKRDSRFLQVFGRLRPGVKRGQAQTELNGIAARLASAYPDTNKDFPAVRLETFNERFNGGNIRTVMLAMMGAVGFVLLIACANVANLQLSIGAPLARGRGPHCLGATRWRVIRRLLVESVVLGPWAVCSAWASQWSECGCSTRPSPAPESRNGFSSRWTTPCSASWRRSASDRHPVRPRARAAGDQDERQRSARKAARTPAPPRAMAHGDDGGARARADAGSARRRG